MVNICLLVSASEKLRRRKRGVEGEGEEKKGKTYITENWNIDKGRAVVCVGASTGKIMAKAFQTNYISLTLSPPFFLPT